MDIPQEIIVEVLSHLRLDWASQPAALSNSGLQIALTCKWLYEELRSEIAARRRTILTTALDAEHIEGPPNTRFPLLCMRGRKYRYSSSSEEIVADLMGETDGAQCILSISLTLPLFRIADTDLLWSLRKLVAEGATSHPWVLNLTVVELGEHINNDVDTRRRWVYSVFSFLNAMLSESEGGKLSLLTVSFVSSGTHEQPEADPGFPPRPQDLVAPSRLRGDPPIMNITGPALIPLFYPLTQHLIRRLPDLGRLLIRSCRDRQGSWTTALATWALPRLEHLLLSDIDIPFATLLDFVGRHPNLAIVSCSSLDCVPMTVPALGTPIDLNVREIKGDLRFMKTIFDSNVTLRNLKTVNLDMKGAYHIGPPIGWDDLTLALDRLGQRSSELGIAGPLQLSLTVLATPGMDEWLGTLHQGLQGALKTLRSLLLSGDGTPPPSSLAKGLASLHCVTSLQFKAHEPVSTHGGCALMPTPMPHQTDPSLIVSLIAALPSVKEAYIEALIKRKSQDDHGFPAYAGVLDCEGEPWKELGKVWTASQTLEVLELKEGRSHNVPTVAWRRGSKELLRKLSDSPG